MSNLMQVVFNQIPTLRLKNNYYEYGYWPEIGAERD